MICAEDLYDRVRSSIGSRTSKPTSIILYPDIQVDVDQRAGDVQGRWFVDLYNLVCFFIVRRSSRDL